MIKVTQNGGPEMIVTDLDGTLIGREHVFRPSDLATLRSLGERGCVRCIATGRSLFSAGRVLPRDLPIDYLIFSSGAGVLDWYSQTLIARRSMTPVLAAQTFSALRSRLWDFMVHKPVPLNHHFVYYRSNRNNADFEDRIGRYWSYALEGRPALFQPAEACQFLAVLHPWEENHQIEVLRTELPDATVIRTTSPLDGFSTWVEVFGEGVSKSQGIRFLSTHLGVARENVVAVGNDYNDEDMLRWCGAGYVMEGAPVELGLRFPTISWAGGLAEVVEDSIPRR